MTPRETEVRQPLCADSDGFSLHAAVPVEAHVRRRLESLCRYITQPAPSDERVQLNGAGQVELKLKTQRRDGTTHLVMWPAETHAATSGAGAAAEAATDKLPG